MSPRSLGRRLAARLVRLPGARPALRGLSRKGLLPRGLWRRLPVCLEAIEIDVAGGFLYVVDERDPFTRELYWRGSQAAEAASLVVFHRLTAGAHVVVDVGAHTGLYTLAALAASEEGCCIAVEPVPANLAALRRNLELNGWTSRCEVVEAAAGGADGRMPFHVPSDDEHPMSGSLGTTGFRGLAGDVVEIDVLRLDRILAGRAADVLKIDVEGHEVEVLAGAEEALRSLPAVIVECNPDGPTREVERLLGSLGYTFLHLAPGSGRAVHTINPDPREVYRNFLCLPPGRQPDEYQ